MTKFWTLDVALEALPFIWPNDLVFKSMVRFIYTFPSLVSRSKFKLLSWILAGKIVAQSKRDK